MTKKFLWFRVAGLVCLYLGRYAVHFIVRPSYWQLGYRKDDYPGSRSFGLGPLALVCWWDE